MEPFLAGDGPWWEQLDEGFWRRKEGFEPAADRDTRAIRATAAADRVIRAAFAGLRTGAALPLGYHLGRLGRLRRELDDYGELAEGGDPHAFFREPPPADVTVKRAGLSGFRPWDGHAEALTFESPFAPHHPDLRKAWSRRRRNRSAPARYWRHRHGPRPTIIAIHGFAAEGYMVNEWFFSLPWLYGMGCDVLLVTLPFHGRCQRVVSPFSGHGFFSSGIGWTNEAFAQGVSDVRTFVRYLLDERGVPGVGVSGVAWDPVLDVSRRMLVGGAGDRLAPPKHTRLLWEHWNRCRVHWFPGSHLIHLERGAYLWQLARFLRGIGFLDEDHPSPLRA